MRTIQLYLNLGLTTEQIAGFLHCVMKNKEAFCTEVFPIFRQKIAEIDARINQLNHIKMNLEERMQSILDERQRDEMEE